MKDFLTRPVMPIFSGVIIGELFCKHLSSACFILFFIYLTPVLVLALLALCKAGAFPSFKICLILFTIGFCLGGYRLNSVHFPDIHFEKTATIEGTVCSSTRQRWFDRIVLGDISIGGRQLFSQKVRISLTGNARGKVIRGDGVRVSTPLEDTKKANFPGVSDFSNFLWVQDIFKSGKASRVQILKKSSCPYFRWLSKGKSTVTNFLESHVTQPNLGFFESVVVGNRKKLKLGMKETLKKNGTYHIVAVSGLHFGLIAWIVFVVSERMLNLLPNILFFPLCRFIRPKTINCLVSIPCLFILGDIVGWRSSTMRAFIMITTYLLCEAWDIQSTMSERIALSGVILLLLYPKELFGIGFALSYIIIFFISTALFSGLACSARRLCNSEVTTLFVESIVVSFVVCVTFIPLSSYFFSRVSFIGFVSNALVIPIFSGIVILLACSTAMIFLVPSLAVFPLNMASKISDIIFQGLRILEKIPHTSFWVSPPKTWLVVCSLLSFFLLLGITEKKSRFYALFTAGVILSSLLFYSFSSKPSQESQENIEFFHSRGVSITFISSASRKIIIFEGSAGVEDNFVLSRFAKSLFNRRIGSVDCLVVPKFNMRQLNQLIKINDIFHIKEAVFFDESSPLLRDILSRTASKLRFITCKNFSQNMLPSPIYENIRYRFLSKDGNLGICYQGSKRNFLLYYGAFRRNSTFWQCRNMYGAKLPKVFPKKELVHIINSYKPKVIIFPRSYKRYNIENNAIRLVNLAKTRWARW